MTQSAGRGEPVKRDGCLVALIVFAAVVAFVVAVVAGMVMAYIAALLVFSDRSEPPRPHDQLTAIGAVGAGESRPRSPSPTSPRSGSVRGTAVPRG